MDSSGKRIVLYADDDRDDLEFVRDILAPYPDIELKTFPDGGTILTYLEKLTPADPMPCLVILDINMPVVNGKEVLFRIRERNTLHHLPVVLFTTSSFPPDQAFASQHKADFMTKPLHLAQMDSLVEKVLSVCLPKAKQGNL